MTAPSAAAKEGTRGCPVSRRTIIHLVCLASLLAAPSAAHAAATVSVQGSTIVIAGSDGPDSAFVSFARAGENLRVADTYIVGPGNQSGTDPAATAGAGCTTPEVRTSGDLTVPPLPGAPGSGAFCLAQGIDHIEVTMGAGDDTLIVGGGHSMPASTTVRGGPGNDSLLADAKALSGATELYGDDGDDSLTAFSHSLPVAMFGGPGNDRFTWEGTARGVATTADGGAGADTFEARNALGPDTITGGGGNDSIDVFDNGRGDPDTVTCGAEALSRLHRDPSDHVDAACQGDSFGPSKARLKAALSRLTRASLLRARTLHLVGLAIPAPGKVTATLAGSGGRRGGTLGEVRRSITAGGPVDLTFRVNRSWLRSLRKSERVTLRLVVNYTPVAGVARSFALTWVR